MKDFIVETGPFVRSEQNTKKISLNIFCVLIIFCIFGIIKNGLMPYLAGMTNINGVLFPAIFVLTGIISGLLTDLLCRQIINTNDNGNYFDSLNISLILVCILPINISLIYVVISVIIAIVFKYVMSKFLKNPILSPVLIGWGCVMGAYLFNLIPDLNYLNPLEVDLGTPLANSTMVTYDNYIKPYGNLLDFFLGLVPGGMGSTSALLAIVSYIYLSAKRIIKWRIPLVVVATIFIITYIIGGISDFGIWYPLFQIFSGSLLFGTIFIASNSNTSPLTPIGQILYALFMGIIIVLLRYITPLTDASLVVMLFMPITVFIFDFIGSMARFRFNKSLILFLIAWALILSISCIIGINIKEDVPPKNEIAIIM